MNQFGRIFRITIFGASHDVVVGVTIAGCPAGIALSETDFTADLQRRQSGAEGTTTRREQDIPSIVSGVFNGYTTGAPITVLFQNKEVRSADYESITAVPRPGHADFTARKKYNGFNDYRGGGQFSGRMTVALVAAGVVAKKITDTIDIRAYVKTINGETNGEAQIQQAMAENDSVGGIVECVASGVPVALGEPFFDSVESCISHLAFSVPGVKGIEFGEGFRVATMKGSELNDAFVDETGKTATNHSGGIAGGLTNGNDLVFRVAMRPAASIGKPQQTFDFAKKEMTTLSIQGRHDTAIVLRTPVIFEAVTAIVLADFYLQAGRGKKGIKDMRR